MKHTDNDLFHYKFSNQETGEVYGETTPVIAIEFNGKQVKEERLEIYRKIPINTRIEDLEDTGKILNIEIIKTQRNGSLVG